MDPFQSDVQDTSRFYENDYHPYDENHFALTEDSFRPQMPQQGWSHQPQHTPPYGPPTGGQQHTPPYGPPTGGQQHTPPYGPPTGGQQHTPPYGPPTGGQPHTAPYGPPKGGQQQPDFQHDEAPTAPPPSFVPQMTSASVMAIDAPSMRRCLYRNTYVWLRNGRSFWFYPTFVGRNSVAGYRWSPSRRRWMYFGIDAREIRSFQCF